MVKTITLPDGTEVDVAVNVGITLAVNAVRPAPSPPPPPPPPAFSTQRVSFGDGAHTVQTGATLVNTAYNGTTVPTGIDSGTAPLAYAARNIDGGLLLITARDFYRQQAVSNLNTATKVNAAVTAGASVQMRLYFYDNGGFSRGTYSVQEVNGGSLVGTPVTVTVDESNGPDTATITLTDTDADGKVTVQVSTSGGSGYISINGVDVAAVGSLPTAWN